MLSLVVADGCEGVIAHNVTLGTYNTNNFLEFIQTKVISNFNRQPFILMDIVTFHKSRKIQEPFEDVGHVYFCLSSYSQFLNATKLIFGHIKNHIRYNDF